MTPRATLHLLLDTTPRPKGAPPMATGQVLPVIAIPPCNGFTLKIPDEPELAFAAPAPLIERWTRGGGNPRKNAPKAYAARIPYQIDVLCEIAPDGPVWAVYGLEFDGATITAATYTNKILAARAPIQYISENYPDLYGGPAAPTVTPGLIPTAHGDIFLLPAATNYHHSGPSALTTDVENALKNAANANRPILFALYYEVRTWNDANTIYQAAQADDWPQSLIDNVLGTAAQNANVTLEAITPDEVPDLLSSLTPDECVTIEPTASLNWEACRLQDLWYSWLGNQSSAPFQHAYACGLRSITSLITATNIEPPLPSARSRFYSNLTFEGKPIDYYLPAPTFLLDEATIVHHLNNAARGYIITSTPPSDLTSPVTAITGTDTSDPNTYHNVIRNFEKSVNRCLHPLEP